MLEEDETFTFIMRAGATGLREQCEALPDLPLILQGREATAACHLGETHDPYFTPAGAEAFRRDHPNAIVQFLETGHFGLETHLEEIASAIRRFLAS
jgi:pimeloyl-ACP methyl ester carboxylesterase